MKKIKTWDQPRNKIIKYVKTFEQKYFERPLCHKICFTNTQMEKNCFHVLCLHFVLQKYIASSPLASRLTSTFNNDTKGKLLSEVHSYIAWILNNWWQVWVDAYKIWQKQHKKGQLYYVFVEDTIFKMIGIDSVGKLSTSNYSFIFSLFNILLEEKPIADLSSNWFIGQIIATFCCCDNN